jgi:putative membrane protein
MFAETELCRGTMLLAAGVYPRFIEGIAEVTTLRFRLPSLVVLGSVGVAAGLAILLLAGVVKDLVVAYRWIMYSWFVGLTLGGVPVVTRLLGRWDGSAMIGAGLGFLGMAGLGIAQAQGVTSASGTDGGPLWFGMAGVAGASAMILPGVSGGYLLLVMGMYVPILSGIDAFKEALRAMDVGALLGPTLGVVLPVGIGVVVGVVAVSNALRFLLERYDKLTLGLLVGLLVGAVVGLWPFQEGFAPELGSFWKGREVTGAVLADLDPEDYPTRWFSPSAGQAIGSLALIALGFAMTLGVARIGADDPPPAGAE